MPRLFRALHLTPLASAAILACICVSSFALASHAGHIGGALIGVAHAATLDTPAPAPTPPVDWSFWGGLAVAAMAFGSLVLHAIGGKTHSSKVGKIADELDTLRRTVGGLLPATGVPTSVSTTVSTAPAKGQAGFARPGLMLVITACGVLVACATLKTEVKSFAGGVVTCAKADKAAVQALGLQLGTEALAGALAGGIPWTTLEADAEASGKAQGIDVAACSFGGLLAGLDKLLHPAGTSTSALAPGLFDLGPSHDPLAPGRVLFSAFQAAHGITRVDQ